MLHVIVIRNQLNDDKEIFKYQCLSKERKSPFVSAFQTSISKKKISKKIFPILIYTLYSYLNLESKELAQVRIALFNVVSSNR